MFLINSTIAERRILSPANRIFDANFVAFGRILVRLLFISELAISEINYLDLSAFGVNFLISIFLTLQAIYI